MKAKSFKLAMFLLVFVGSFSFCKKEKPFLVVDETPVNVAIAGGEYFITVKSNGEWTAKIEDAENKNWCVLSNNSGTGDGVITVNIATNTDSLTRNVIVKIISGDLTKSVTFNQGEQKIKITTTTLPDGAIEVVYSQQLTVSGKQLVTWTLLNGDLPNGLTLSSDGIISGMPTIEGTFDFTVQATNDTIGSDSKTLSIAIKPVYLIVEERFIMLESIDNSHFITIKSNGKWTAIIENAANRNWCTLSNSNGSGNGKIIVNAAQNTGDLMRVAVVKIVSDELTKSVLVCQNLKVTNNEIMCGWDYPIKPGTPEWAEGKNIIDSLQIPKHILDSLSTACLAKICLRYPLLYDMFAFNSKKDGFNRIFNEFNGIRELYKREKGLNKLLKEYHNLINVLDESSKILPINALEVLLYGYSEKVEAPIENYKNILLYLTVGYEKKLKYPDHFGWPRYSFFARSNVIIKIDPALIEIFNGKYVLFSGLADADLINTIDSLSYKLIKE